MELPVLVLATKKWLAGDLFRSLEEPLSVGDKEDPPSFYGLRGFISGELSSFVYLTLAFIL